MSFEEYLLKKSESIKFIENEDGVILGVAYPNKLARHTSFEKICLNKKIRKNPSDPETFACRDLAKFWVRYLLDEDRSPNEAKRRKKGLDSQQIQSAYKDYGDYNNDTTENSCSIFKIEHLGLYLSRIAGDMSAGEKKLLYIRTSNHVVSILIRIKERPSRVVLNFFDPNSTNMEIRVFVENAEDLKHVNISDLLHNDGSDYSSFYQMLPGSFICSHDYNCKAGSLKTLLKNGDKVGPWVDVLPNLERSEKEGVINYICTLVENNSMGFLGFVVRYAPDKLESILGLAEECNNSDQIKKDIITSLYQLDMNGWSGLALFARYAPEQLERVFDFVEGIENSDQIKKGVITALCQQNQDRWSGLALVAQYAPRQMQKLLDFAGVDNQMKIDIVNALCVLADDEVPGFKAIAFEDPWVFENLLYMAARYAPSQIGVFKRTAFKSIISDAAVLEAPRAITYLKGKLSDNVVRLNRTGTWLFHTELHKAIQSAISELEIPDKNGSTCGFLRDDIYYRGINSKGNTRLNCFWDLRLRRGLFCSGRNDDTSQPLITTGMI